MKCLDKTQKLCWAKIGIIVCTKVCCSMKLNCIFASPQYEISSSDDVSLHPSFPRPPASPVASVPPPPQPSHQYHHQLHYHCHTPQALGVKQKYIILGSIINVRNCFQSKLWIFLYGYSYPSTYLSFGHRI